MDSSKARKGAEEVAAGHPALDAQRFQEQPQKMGRHTKVREMRPETCS